jgi:hypothetical protein
MSRLSAVLTRESPTIRPLTCGLEVPVVVFGVDGLADHIRRTRTREEVVVLLSYLVVELKPATSSQNSLLMIA